VQPTPQRLRADREAFRGQVVRQQRHRPARGLVAAAARVARQGRRQPLRREPRLTAGTSAARPVDQGRGLMLGPVLHQPAMHTGAVDPAAAGRFGDGMPLGHQQQRLEAAIHTGLAGASQRGSKPRAIRLIEPRLGRVIMVLHAPQQTPAMLALQDL